MRRALQCARLTLKHHRFEVVSAAVAATAVALAALWVTQRLAGVDLGASCVAGLRAGSDLSPECSRQLNAFSRINGEEASKVFVAMAFLPFVLGLVGGVPLVGREIEARTAQTAWWLAASRRRWLTDQIWPVLLVLGVAMGFAAASTESLEATRSTLPSLPLSDLGLHGEVAAARALAAFGLGLIAGAVVGRTLPALIVGAAASILLLGGVAIAHQAWLHAHASIVMDQAQLDDPNSELIPVEQVWRGPNGVILSQAEAMQLASESDSLEPDSWLEQGGYEVLQRGVTVTTMESWEQIETLAVGGVGLVLLPLTIAVVDRRRPR